MRTQFCIRLQHYMRMCVPEVLKLYRHDLILCKLKFFNINLVT